VAGRRARRGPLHYIGRGLSWGLLGLVLALAAALVVVPAVAGATPLTVLTSSMEPKLPPGTLIVVKPTPIDQIRIGSVLTYQIEPGTPAVISHRVIQRNSDSDGSVTFITKGDNNDQPDPKPVQEGQVRGTLWYSLPWIGYISTAVNGENKSWLIPVIGVALLGYAVFMVLSAIVSRARKNRERDGAPRGRRSARAN
jgi:signal peptidase